MVGGGGGGGGGGSGCIASPSTPHCKILLHLLHLPSCLVPLVPGCASTAAQHNAVQTFLRDPIEVSGSSASQQPSQALAALSVFLGTAPARHGSPQCATPGLGIGINVSLQHRTKENSSFFAPGIRILIHTRPSLGGTFVNPRVRFASYPPSHKQASPSPILSARVRGPERDESSASVGDQLCATVGLRNCGGNPSSTHQSRKRAHLALRANETPFPFPFPPPPGSRGTLHTWVGVQVPVSLSIFSLFPREPQFFHRSRPPDRKPLSSIRAAGAAGYPLWNLCPTLGVGADTALQFVHPPSSPSSSHRGPSPAEHLPHPEETYAASAPFPWLAGLPPERRRPRPTILYPAKQYSRPVVPKLVAITEILAYHITPYTQYMLHGNCHPTISRHQSINQPTDGLQPGPRKPNPTGVEVTSPTRTAGNPKAALRTQSPGSSLLRSRGPSLVPQTHPGLASFRGLDTHQNRAAGLWTTIRHTTLTHASTRTHTTRRRCQQPVSIRIVERFPRQAGRQTPISIASQGTTWHLTSQFQQTAGAEVLREKARLPQALGQSSKETRLDAETTAVKSRSHAEPIWFPALAR
ncbi:hypothetical protein CMUS01_04102 [Colletotrichum musicola]|uniref:Uncharacterized protein n=1 Tax=Colletotrichum musicola TaxID=2175873 RepID=A0A8H6U117_9PEZI|nr:hypothetical protein CMUS01_04102 [Colletotrichum musicola]